MKTNIRKNPRKQRSRNFSTAALETLEPRNLLSFSFGGITIPSIPGIPSIPSGFKLPAFTNGFNLGTLNSYLNPNPSDYWWLKNTGQTLTNPQSGPATGTPGADISAQDAWNITTGNSNVVIAVLDTGIDLQNEGLMSSVWNNPNEIPGDGIDNDGDGHIDDVNGWNFLNNSSDVSDNFVHGTAVAATLHSVAPGVTILPVEIGTAEGVTSQNVINGINYLIYLKNHGVNIVAINASYIDFNAPSQGEVDAIKSAGDSGMLYVAAAGNGGLNLDTMIPSIPSALAKYIPQFLPSNLVFVAATDNQDNLASFSDYGSNTVAVGAPGVDITLPIPGGLYASLSGTSFAAPMVSGIAALLKSRFPNATMSQIKDAILKSGDTDPSLVGKTITGKRVDAYKALNYMLGNQPSTGAVETLNNSEITGWAFDPNLGTSAASVQIVIDGKIAATVTADIERDDLTETLGSANHGFTYDTSALGYGKHTIKVLALDPTSGKTTQIGAGTIIVNNLPTGALETTSNKNITGWADDSDTPTKSISVKLFLDGKAWMTAPANIDRPDLAEALGTDTSGMTKHGYNFKLGTLKPGVHQLATYAIDSLTGETTLIGTTSITVNKPATGAVETLSATTLSGWAFDPDAGAASIQVCYQIDTGPLVYVTANLPRPDLQNTLKSKNHGYSITLPTLEAGDHTVSVWAIDPNIDSPILISTQVLTIAPILVP